MYEGLLLGILHLGMSQLKCQVALQDRAQATLVTSASNEIN